MIRAEINEKEMKETTLKINKTKNWFLEKINKIDAVNFLIVNSST